MQRFLKEYWMLITFVVLGIFISGFFIIRYPGLQGDAIRYLYPVHNYFNGQGYTIKGMPYYYHSPGYGFLAYLFYQLVGDIEYSGMLTSSIAYLLVIITVFVLTRRLFGKRSALLASFFVTLCPTLFTYSFIPLTECTYSLFFFLNLLIFVRILTEKNTYLRSALLGGLLGFTYLIRPEAFLIAILAIITLFVFAFLNRTENKAFIYPVITLIIFLILTLPFIVYMHKHTGRWMVSARMTHTLIRGEVPAEGKGHYRKLAIEHPEYFRNTYHLGFFEYFASRKGKIISRMSGNIRTEILQLIKIDIHGLLPLFVVGSVYLFHFPKFSRAQRRPLGPREKNIILSFLIFLSPLFVYPVFFVSERYMISYACLILIVIAWCLNRFLERISACYDGRHVSSAMTGIGILSIIGLTLYFGAPNLFIAKPELTKRLAKRNDLALRSAGFWLRDHVADMKKKSFLLPAGGVTLLFYANAKQGLQGRIRKIDRDALPSDLSKLLNREKAQYLILNRFSVKTFPQLQPLWRKPQLASSLGLKLVHWDKGIDSDGPFQVYSVSDQ